MSRVVKVPKLVRDNMPDIWARHGDKVEWHIIQGEERKRALLEKLVEEANEALADPCAEEFADVLETLLAAASAHGISQGRLLYARNEKLADRGGFDRGVYLTAFEWGPTPR